MVQELKGLLHNHEGHDLCCTAHSQVRAHGMPITTALKKGGAGLPKPADF